MYCCLSPKWIGLPQVFKEILTIPLEAVQFSGYGSHAFQVRHLIIPGSLFREAPSGFGDFWISGGHYVWTSDGFLGIFHQYSDDFEWSSRRGEELLGGFKNLQEFFSGH